MRHLHNIVITAMILSSVLILVGLGAIAVSASEPPPQHSHTLIQNMSSEVADVSVEFYDPDGTLRHTVAFTLAGNGARTIHTWDYAQLGASWRGSQVVTSSEPIMATVVNYGSPSAHNIYEGFDSSQADTQLFMPSIHWNPLGQWSTIAIQNVYTETAEVEITYYDRSGNAVVGPISATIPPGASEFRETQTDCTGGVCGTYPEGSMRVVSTNGKKIAAVVMENVHDGTYSYQAVPPSKADTTFLLPSIHHNPRGQFSHILVQNTSDSLSTLVTIEYLDQAGNVVDTFTHPLAANGAYTFHTTNEVPEEEPTHLGDEGAARVTSDTTDVVVTVVETVLGRPYAYNGFNSTDGGMTILFPSVHHNPLGQYSHILVQNTSGSTGTTLTITYYRPDGSVANTFDRSIAAGGSYTFHTTNEVPADDPTNMPDEGSAVVTSSATNVVAVCVETVHMVPGVYEGFD